MVILLGTCRDSFAFSPMAKIKEPMRSSPYRAAVHRTAALNGLNLSISKKKDTQKRVLLFGGLEEIRTPDPHNANVVRSQLRYKPVFCFLREAFPPPGE